jgi:hypothetical protein
VWLPVNRYVALMIWQKVLTGIGVHLKVEIIRAAVSGKESQHGRLGAVAAIGAPTSCSHTPTGGSATNAHSGRGIVKA